MNILQCNVTVAGDKNGQPEITDLLWLDFAGLVNAGLETDGPNEEICRDFVVPQLIAARSALKFVVKNVG